eukprot:s2480_g1.t1
MQQCRKWEMWECQVPRELRSASLQRNPKEAAARVRAAKAKTEGHPKAEKTLRSNRPGTTVPWANSQARHQRQGVQVSQQEASQAKKSKTRTRHDWAPESRHAGSEQHLDCFGRAWNMNKVVVNFLNVGHFYGSKVVQQAAFAVILAALEEGEDLAPFLQQFPPGARRSLVLMLQASLPAT